MRKQLTAMAATALMAAATVVGGAGQASAASEGDGYCDAGEVCFFSHSGSTNLSTYNGWHRDTFYTRPQWTDLLYVWKNSPTEKYPLYNGTDGSVMNATGAWNRDTGKVVRVYYNSGWGGRYYTVPKGGKVNVFGNSLDNRANSHAFI
ncbi:hypothetical protein [Streptomyces sp. NPDC058572]|uniref:hypothetical protein n=1 Tax=Streptomyces sp. NPDC058572 TaxID=3346546 RepID=UPI0036493C1B